jgi:hypothetical protein
VLVPLNPQQASEDNAPPEEADQPAGTERPESDDLRAANRALEPPRVGREYVARLIVANRREWWRGVDR